MESDYQAIPAQDSAFGRDARLRSRQQLDAMRDPKFGARKLAGRYCVMVVKKTPPDGQRRAAFLISRRFSLLAVERNRARRLFRETYRQLYHSLPCSWVLFIPRRPILTCKQQEVQVECESLLRRLGLLSC